MCRAFYSHHLPHPGEFNMKICFRVGTFEFGRSEDWALTSYITVEGHHLEYPVMLVQGGFTNGVYIVDFDNT